MVNNKNKAHQGETFCLISVFFKDTIEYESQMFSAVDDSILHQVTTV